MSIGISRNFYGGHVSNDVRILAIVKPQIGVGMVNELEQSVTYQLFFAIIYSRYPWPEW